MKTVKFLSIVLVTLIMSSCNDKGVTKKALETELDSVSYAVGLNMGSQMRAGFDEIDLDRYIQGLRSGIDSTDVLLDQAGAQQVVQSYFQQKQQAEAKKKQEEAAKKAEEQYADVKAAGEKFLAENTTKEGVEITESGLQYIVMKKGTGEIPSPTDKAKVHYHGTTIDGTVFDSSIDRDKPFTFSLEGGVISGWIEGVKLMPVGSKYKFFIPQELAYGANPRPGGVIKPFAPLIFEIELLEIVK